MTKTTTTLRVPDMTCGHCELSVQEALNELDGVERVKADHQAGTVEVTHEEGKVTTGRMGEAIEEVGYTLVV